MVFEGQSVKDLHYMECPAEGKGQNNNCEGTFLFGQLIKPKCYLQLTHTHAHTYAPIIDPHSHGVFKIHTMSTLPLVLHVLAPAGLIFNLSISRRFSTPPFLCGIGGT